MITACVNVRDDEATIERWVRHVAPHVAEIVVCDTGSVDATRDILDRLDEPKLRVIERPWTGFIDGRNTFFEQVRTPLILQLDIDELLLQRFWDGLAEHATDLIADVADSIRLPHFNATFVTESVAQVERRALDFDANFEPFSYPRDVLYRADLPRRGVRWVATGGAEVMNVLDTDRVVVADDPLLHCYPHDHKMRSLEYQARKIVTYHHDLGGDAQPQWAEVLGQFTAEQVAEMREAAATDSAHHSSWWAATGRHEAAVPRRLAAGDPATETIFVTIAAYRDTELAPTVLDAIGQAHHPGRLRFGICHQDDAPPPVEIARLPNVRIDHVAATDSEGACWARARAQGLYDGEGHILQIDSHMRFEPGWDSMLIEMSRSVPSERPIITTYPCMYEPGRPIDRNQPPNAVVFARFSNWGCVEYGPRGFEPDELANGPVPARHFCAGFAFAPGSFVADIPYDPGVYFLGEEVTHGARAYTHGYDFFHPDRNVAYHYYGRPDEPKHWADHWADPELTDRTDELHVRSERRVRGLLGMRGDATDDLGPYTLGTVRSITDYEAYCGVDFARSVVDRHAAGGEPPPSPASAIVDLAAPERVVLTVLDVAGALAVDAERWQVTIRDRWGTVRVDRPVDRPDIARVLATGHPELVVPYRAVVTGGTWSLTLFDAAGVVIDTLTGELREPAQSSSPG